MKIEQLDISGKLYCIKLTAVLACVNLYMICITSNRGTWREMKQRQETLLFSLGGLNLDLKQG